MKKAVKSFTYQTGQTTYRFFCRTQKVALQSIHTEGSLYLFTGRRLVYTL